MSDQPPMTPAKLLKQAAFVFVFIHAVGIFMLASCDAQRDDYHFRYFALALIWASASLVVSTFLATRRAWKGQPPADWMDGVLPAGAIFALGWLIWLVTHHIVS
jgi:hypothetical protein